MRISFNRWVRLKEVNEAILGDDAGVPFPKTPFTIMTREQKRRRKQLRRASMRAWYEKEMNESAGN